MERRKGRIVNALRTVDQWESIRCPVFLGAKSTVYEMWGRCLLLRLDPVIPLRAYQGDSNCRTTTIMTIQTTPSTKNVTLSLDGMLNSHVRRSSSYQPVLITSRLPATHSIDVFLGRQLWFKGINHLREAPCSWYRLVAHNALQLRIGTDSGRLLLPRLWCYWAWVLSIAMFGWW